MKVNTKTLIALLQNKETHPAAFALIRTILYQTFIHHHHHINPDDLKLQQQKVIKLLLACINSINISSNTTSSSSSTTSTNTNNINDETLHTIASIIANTLGRHLSHGFAIICLQLFDQTTQKNEYDLAVKLAKEIDKIIKNNKANHKHSIAVLKLEEKFGSEVSRLSPEYDKLTAATNNEAQKSRKLVLDTLLNILSNIYLVKFLLLEREQKVNHLSNSVGEFFSENPKHHHERLIQQNTRRIQEVLQLYWGKFEVSIFKKLDPVLQLFIKWKILLSTTLNKLDNTPQEHLATLTSMLETQATTLHTYWHHTKSNKIPTAKLLECFDVWENTLSKLLSRQTDTKTQSTSSQFTDSKITLFSPKQKEKGKKEEKKPLLEKHSPNTDDTNTKVDSSEESASSSSSSEQKL